MSLQNRFFKVPVCVALTNTLRYPTFSKEGFGIYNRKLINNTWNNTGMISWPPKILIGIVQCVVVQPTKE